MKKYKEENQILIYACILATIIFVILLVVNLLFSQPLTYAIGFLLCFVVGAFGFLKSNYVITRVVYGSFLNPSKALIINSITNNLLYFAILLATAYFKCFHILFACGGLFIIKIVVIVYNIVNKDKGENIKDDIPGHC